MAVSITLAAVACGGPAREDASADASSATTDESPAATVEPPSQDTDVVTDTSASQWTAGITRKQGSPSGAAMLIGVRTARNDGFDRFVLEFAGQEVPDYHVEYIDRPVRQCGSGNVVDMAGDGWLMIRVEPANAHDDNGRPTITERHSRPALPVVLETRLICDFEAQVEWVLGVSSPNRYRVTELAQPPRLVVDIRYR